MKRLTPGLGGRLEDPAAESARRNHEQRIDEIQKLPASGLGVVNDVLLVNDVNTPVPHNLGRRPLAVLPTPVRGAISVGQIEEVRDGTVDLAKFVVLKATGYGASVTVNVVVL